MRYVIPSSAVNVQKFYVKIEQKDLKPGQKFSRVQGGPKWEVIKVFGTWATVTNGLKEVTLERDGTFVWVEE